MITKKQNADMCQYAKNAVAAIIRDFPMKNSSKKSRNMLEKCRRILQSTADHRNGKSVSLPQQSACGI